MINFQSLCIGKLFLIVFNIKNWFQINASYKLFVALLLELSKWRHLLIDQILSYLKIRFWDHTRHTDDIKV